MKSTFLAALGAHNCGRLKSTDFAVCTLKSIKIAQINKNERNQHIWCVQMKRALVGTLLLECSKIQGSKTQWVAYSSVRMKMHFSYQGRFECPRKFATAMEGGFTHQPRNHGRGPRNRHFNHGNSAAPVIF